MTEKKTPRTRHRRTSPHRHQPGESRCMDILRQLSEYIDDELPSDICAELRHHLGACPNCEEFIASLRDTVKLCRNHQPPPLSAQERAMLRQEILQSSKLEARR
jgi:anti-sigma factor RsiW